MRFRAALLATVVATAVLGAGSASGMSLLSSDASRKGATPAYNPERNAYFGDLHIHTRYSFDAFIFNTRATPEDAYRYAKGEPIHHVAGYDVRLETQPLDFAAVTDHSEYLGLVDAMADPNNPLSKHPLASQFIRHDPAGISQAFRIATQRPRFIDQYPELADSKIDKAAWDHIVGAAEEAYEPGRLTTFIAYEFTAGVDGKNLHRNIVFRGSRHPELPMSAINFPNPEDMWRWLDGLRAQGIEALAIPHNSNGSDGIMFDRTTFDGGPIDAAYAELRMRNEPVVEITQVKGTSETHPLLSPNDEWADFELLETYIGSAKPVTQFAGGYVRDALKAGLEMADTQGFNPYHFGFTAASDTHNAAAPVDEDHYFGKVGLLDGTPQSRGILPASARVSATDAASMVRYTHFGASGVGGVWAEENTREAIYDAFRRKETFATSGPRIRVRFFGGYDYDESILGDPEMAKKAYAGGVPMGADLEAAEGKAPAFLVWAMRDPSAAWLQRVQIVKGWVEGGKAQERVYDVACSDGLTPDPTSHRCPDNGATVSLKDCSITQDRGAVELKTLWRDPDFKAGERSFYYVRVLQNPTCRWSTWDSLRLGFPLNKNVAKTIQERAWSSPIWYMPKT